MTRRTGIWIGVLVLVAAGVAFGVKTFREKLMVHLPDYPAIQEAKWLDQNWSAKDRKWYHHANQGTFTFGIPYEWFMALEQPELSLGATGLLSDPLYLDRFGFIPGSTEGDKGGLSIGFARGEVMNDYQGKPWLNPETKKHLTGIGLTCAACHTGRFTHGKTTVLIDGGSALVDLGQLRQGLGISILFTKYLPFRFERFAERVLGPNASKEAKTALEKQLDDVWVVLDKVRKLDKHVEDKSIVEGFGRLDALNRIGNQVFGLALHNDENYVATSAPVHFPRIWDAPWFDWVQYNGSIEQPMVRNAGEALGVSALINLTNPGAVLFESTVQIRELVAIEKLLAGAEQPTAKSRFTGLRSPKWDETILPEIKKPLADIGAKLYLDHCASCHLPPVSSTAFWDSEKWLKANPDGQRYLEVTLVDISYIGTDAAQATDMMNRKVVTPPGLGIKEVEFGPALGKLVEKAVNHWYDSQNPPVAPAERNEMNGYRSNGIQAPLKYKARSLNGVWATPPYLHNGSVPNIYALLSPVSKRPDVFYLGNREYDPVNLGYKSEEFPNGFKFDTSKRGNHNTGHEFSDEKKPGVIGRALSHDERMALIEFLKTQ